MPVYPKMVTGNKTCNVDEERASSLHEHRAGGEAKCLLDLFAKAKEVYITFWIFFHLVF